MAARRKLARNGGRLPHPAPANGGSHLTARPPASTPETVPHPNKCRGSITRPSNRFVKQPGQLNLLRINKPLSKLTYNFYALHARKSVYTALLIHRLVSPAPLSYLSPRSIILPRVNSNLLNSVIAQNRIE